MAIVFGTSNPAQAGIIARGIKHGKLRKLASRVYSDDLHSPVEDIIRHHYLEIAAHFFPGAVISHRSAIESSVRGTLHLTTSGSPSTHRLPGLVIRAWQGPPPQSDDIQTTFGTDILHTSSQPRAILENLQVAKPRKNDESKSLPQQDLEHWLDRHIRIFGIEWLHQMLRRTEAVAKRLRWQSGHEKFWRIANAMLGKPSSFKLATEAGKARAKGTPFDPQRLNLFQKLHARLAKESFQSTGAPLVAEADNRAFWEAYFSNYIEGTKFTVEEAQAIVYLRNTASRNLLRKRPEDAHDVLETYRLIRDRDICAATPESPGDLIKIIKRRHARMMAGRPNVQPGVLKTKNNMAGSHIFVAPDLVEETLARGWRLRGTLPDPVRRAFYMLFFIAEVHPFNDGNGRVSRLCMNAELEAAHQRRLIIPTSLRNDYLAVLQALSSSENTEPFIAFGHKLIEFNRQMPFASFEATHQYLLQTRALDENPAFFALESFAAMREAGTGQK